MRTMPTAAMKLIIGIVPLPVYIKSEAMAACYRLRLNSQWSQTNCGHTVIRRDLFNSIPLSQMRSDKILPQFFFDKKYEVYIPTRDDWQYNNVVLDDEIICFTDGSRIESCSQSGAGLFNYTDSEEFSFPLGKFSSVFQAQLYAILHCTKLDGLLCRHNVSIAICSDSP